MTDFWTLTSLMFILVAMGLFTWLVIERLRYYKSAEPHLKTRVMLLSIGCIGALIFAAGVHGFRTNLK